ncbi:MAG: response regulator transcription factor [Hydrogenophaga sp.]|jgi:DNA-binding NarL/FixJ family response regulator|uniref:response regulator transcription factor n=1 Tax=Hydrogenophaga sp. TaxID=1904254 RepID=UPI00274FC95A|nr:response regulator transcription factor [Hydrogenophaga sp.]MDP2419548.1 response regulator transcription factor [Hydrogenophaga sp.]MDZ4173270.1 response regulator transcription factor [Hydrogenophaga sp.]
MQPDSYVIVLDDHPLVGRGMAQYLQSIHADMKVSVTANWDEVKDLLQSRGCPLMLVADVWLASSSSLGLLAQWRLHCGETPWLAMSGDDDPSVQQRVQMAGAQGFVHKQASPEDFGRAFAALLEGQRWFESDASHWSSAPRTREWDVTPAELGLTPRQGEILALVLRGLPNKRIALKLGVSESTVKEHLTGILERLGVRTRVEVLTHLRGRRLVLELPSCD